VLWLAGTTAPSATYGGAFGHTYAFYSVAIDNVGHRQAVPIQAQASTMTTVVFGDVNLDNLVNVFDALQSLRYAVGLYQPTDENTFKATADVAPLDNSGKPKGDGTVNVFDALAILRHAVGLDVW
jgi:hypothetical protein